MRRLKVGPHVSPALAARLAHEALLDVGEPEIVGPAVGGHGDGVAAPVVGAVDQDAPRAVAAFAHFAESDLLGSHALLKRGTAAESNAVSQNDGWEMMLDENELGNALVGSP